MQGSAPGVGRRRCTLAKGAAREAIDDALEIAGEVARGLVAVRPVLAMQRATMAARWGGTSAFRASIGVGSASIVAASDCAVVARSNGRVRVMSS